jgi:hypothetical protein
MIILYGLTEFAEELGGKWNRKSMQVYYKRGKLPEPFAMVGIHPLWTIDQIEEYKAGLKFDDRQ